VTADIDAEQDGLLYTSIIYDKGWHVYIDGKETEYTSIGDALMAVPVTAGKHTIEMQYYPEGKKAGRILTIASILILAGIILFEKKKKGKAGEEENENAEEVLTEKYELTEGNSEERGEINPEAETVPETGEEENAAESAMESPEENPEDEIVDEIARAVVKENLEK